jgi:hypothetical protein
MMVNKTRLELKIVHKKKSNSIKGRLLTYGLRTSSGMRELDEYSAVKFNLRSSQRDKLRLHQERDITIAEVKELVKKRVKPPRQTSVDLWSRETFFTGRP